jgi:hypothetical protein
MADTSNKRGKVYERAGRFYVDIKMPNGQRFRRSCGTSRTHAYRILALKRSEISEWEEANAPGTFAACWSHYLKRLSIEGKRQASLRLPTVGNIGPNSKGVASRQSRKQKMTKQSTICPLLLGARITAFALYERP